VKPLSHLDARLKEEVRDEIRGLSNKLGIAVLYVTHDQVEAIALADRIGVMSDGKILQIGIPQGLYHFPADRSVAEFFGFMNEFDIGVMICAVPKDSPRSVTVAIRPEEVDLSSEPYGPENQFLARLSSQVFLGDLIIYHFEVEGKKLLAKTTRPDPQLRLGGDVFVRFSGEKLKIFPRR